MESARWWMGERRKLGKGRSQEALKTSESFRSY
jgi:hypothetical protein